MLEGLESINNKMKIMQFCRPFTILTCEITSQECCLVQSFRFYADIKKQSFQETNAFLGFVSIPKTIP